MLLSDINILSRLNSISCLLSALNWDHIYLRNRTKVLESGIISNGS